MIDVRSNFKNNYIKKSDNSEIKTEALLCQLCKEHADSAENIFKCTVLTNNTVININNNKFEDLYSKNMKVVSSAIKYFSKLWKLRQQKMEDMNKLKS